jgi:hypothetical protein
MGAPVFYPYPETTLHWLNGTSQFTVVTPWLRVSAEVDARIRERLAGVADRWSQLTPDDPDFSFVSEFFRQLAPAPVAYVLPRAMESGLIDPLSLFTSALRRIYLGTLIQSESRSFAENLKQLAVRDEDRFCRAFAVVVRRAHHLTAGADEILELASRFQPAALRALLGEYRREESGHDRLLADSLHSLGFEPLDVPVAPAHREQMDVLKTAATESPLAFALMLAKMEWSTHSHRTPELWPMLAGSERTRRASQGLWRHYRLNDQGEHCGIGWALVNALEPLARSDASAAMALVNHFIRTEVAAIRETMKLALDQSPQ